MKKIPMFLLLLAPYLFLLTVVMTVISENGFTAKALDTAAGIYLGMLLMILIPNMVYAFILKGHGYELRKLFFWNMLLKLSHIPIYFLVFAAGLFLGLMIVGMMLIPFLVIFDYSLLLSSSMYGISGIWGLARAGKLSAAGAVLLIVCQLLFVADVVCAVYLYCRFRKRFG